MRIFVLGAAGYVGSVLCRKLLHDGHEVVAIDNGFFGFGGLDEIRYDHGMRVLEKDGFDLVQSDLECCDCFINLSGLSNDPMADFNPALNYKLNTDLTEYTAKLCKSICDPVRMSYIFASTASIYDFGVADEKLDVVMDETSKVNPILHYSLSKYKAEQKLLDLADGNFNAIILRKATICGYSPRMRYDLVINTLVKDGLNDYVLRLNGGGENWRPLIDINDMCEIYSRCVNLDKTGIYNAVGYNIRVSELALRVMSELQLKMGAAISIESDYNFPKSKIRNYRVDGSKLWSEINFKPQISVQETVSGILNKISQIRDFGNPVYYNIRWVEKYLQHWLKY